MLKSNKLIIFFNFPYLFWWSLFSILLVSILDTVMMGISSEIMEAAIKSEIIVHLAKEIWW